MRFLGLVILIASAAIAIFWQRIIAEVEPYSPQNARWVAENIATVRTYVYPVCTFFCGFGLGLMHKKKERIANEPSQEVDDNITLVGSSGAVSQLSSSDGGYGDPDKHCDPEEDPDDPDDEELDDDDLDEDEDSEYEDPDDEDADEDETENLDEEDDLWEEDIRGGELDIHDCARFVRDKYDLELADAARILQEFSESNRDEAVIEVMRILGDDVSKRVIGFCDTEAAVRLLMIYGKIQE